jgi:hypothetical protein
MTIIPATTAAQANARPKHIVVTTAGLSAARLRFAGVARARD